MLVHDMPSRAPLLSIVAPGSDYGKTRLVTGIISELSKLGIKACAIKHTRHTSPADAGKDTCLFREAGAAASALVDENGLASVYLPKEGIQGAARAMEHLVPDVLLCEGFKDYPYPKILIARGEGDLPAATALKGVIAIASAEGLSVQGLPSLKLDPMQLAKFIAAWLAEQRGGQE